MGNYTITYLDGDEKNPGTYHSEQVDGAYTAVERAKQIKAAGYYHVHLYWMDNYELKID